MDQCDRTTAQCHALTAQQEQGSRPSFFFVLKESINSSVTTVWSNCSELLYRTTSLTSRKGCGKRCGSRHIENGLDVESDLGTVTLICKHYSSQCTETPHSTHHMAEFGSAASAAIAHRQPDSPRQFSNVLIIVELVLPLAEEPHGQHPGHPLLPLRLK